MKYRLRDSWRSIVPYPSSTFWMHILIQNPCLVSSDKPLYKRISFMSLEKKIVRRDTVHRSPSIAMESKHRLTYPILIRWLSTVFLKNGSGTHYLLHIILRIFSEYCLEKVHIRRCWAIAAIFIFQVKIVSSKSL